MRRGLALGAAVAVLAACGSATDSGSAGSGPTEVPPASATVPSSTAVVATTTTAVSPETLSTAAIAGPAALTVLGADGQVRWEAPPIAGFVSATQAAIGDGVVLAATICDGPVAVRAWDLDSGAPLWSAVLPDSQAGGASLAVTDGVALATAAGGTWAFDDRTGVPRQGWSPAPPATDATTIPPGYGSPAGVPLVTAAGVTVTSPGCPTPGTD